MQIGEKFTPHPCSDAGGAQTPSVCTSPNGGLIIAASHRPYGMAGDVYLTQDSAGVVEQIIATVEAGHDGSIARTMVEKYGAPDFIRDDGEHHWIGERVSVLYKPAAHHQEGMIVVASRNLLDRQRQAKEEAKSRKL